MFERDEEISDEGQETDSDDVEETADAEIESDETESEEQSDEDQDLEEEEEVDEEPAKAASSKFKTKDGDFNWKEINKVIGNGELEKSHKEAQQAVTRAYEEKKAAEVRVQQFGKKAELFDHFDQIYQNFPQVQQAIEAAMSGGRSPNMGQQQLPQGLDPNDPVIPMLLQLQEVVGSLSNQSRQEQQRQRQEAEVSQFRQGLSDAQEEYP
jgi:hypothetical protein